jgi:hypothetical protein
LVRQATGNVDFRAEVMSGSKRGEQLFKLMQEGNTVCSILVSDLLAETLVLKKDSKVKP